MTEIDKKPEMIGLDTCALFSVINALFDHGERGHKPEQLSGQEDASQFIRFIQEYVDRNCLIIPSFVNLEHQINLDSARGNVLDSVGRWEQDLIDAMMQSQRYLPVFNDDPSFKRMEEIAADYRERVREFQKTREGRVSVLLDEYSLLVQGWIDRALKDDAYDESYVKNLNAEAEHRYNQRMPPGYMDKDKNEGWPSEFPQILPWRRKFGDFYIWKEFLRVIEGQRPKSVWFITAEEKEDWWEKLDPSFSTDWQGRKELKKEVLKYIENCEFRLMTPKSVILTA